jgi:DNA topoisomerase-3
MRSVLMVAEKPSIAEAIAKSLAPGGAFAFHKTGKTPVLEFQAAFPNPPFRGERCTFRVTSVTGHVFSLDFHQEFQNWDKTDPATLFRAPTEKKSNDKGGMVRHLQSQAAGAHLLVLWLDCDREGENICYGRFFFFSVPTLLKIGDELLLLHDSSRVNLSLSLKMM